MGKKPYCFPKAPPGPQYRFFEELQDLAIRAGDLSAQKIGEKAGLTRHVVYRSLVGPNLPPIATVRVIVPVLAGLAANVDGDVAMSRFNDLWLEALADARATKLLPHAVHQNRTDIDEPASATPTQADTNPDVATQPAGAIPGLARHPRRNVPIKLSLGGPETAERLAFVTTLVEMINRTTYSVSAVAWKIGVQPATVRNWLHGRRLPNVKKVAKFAAALSLSEVDTERLLDQLLAVHLEAINATPILQHADRVCR